MFENTKKSLRDKSFNNMDKSMQDLATQLEWLSIYATQGNVNMMKSTLVKMEKSALELSVGSGILRRTL